MCKTKKLIAFILSVLMIFTMVPWASADEDSYTLEELIQRTENNSSELNRLKKKTQRGEVTRDRAAAVRSNTPLGGSVGLEAIQARQAILNLMQEDLQLTMAQREVDVKEEQLSNEVLFLYFDIQQARRDLEEAKQKKELTEKETMLATIRQRFGKISRFELKREMDRLEEVDIEISKAEQKLEQAFEELNLKANLPLENRYAIIREEDEKPELPEVSRQVTRVLNNSPNIWLLEQQVELATIGLRLYVYNENLDPYSAQRIDIATAELALSNARSGKEELVRSLYNSLEQMETEKRDLELALTQLEDQREVLVVRLDQGMTIPIELEKLDFQKQSLENALKSIEEAEEKLQVQIMAPWAIAR
ncbi:MAG: TolC family protein [Tindallia sp. MSAO_Bac2]|nr:MAG: TolC family protein [Tindallia sp. MSAO_Bac2]